MTVATAPLMWSADTATDDMRIVTMTAERATGAE
jgi:hypothetical protein